VAQVCKLAEITRAYVATQLTHRVIWSLIEGRSIKSLLMGSSRRVPIFQHEAWPWQIRRNEKGCRGIHRPDGVSILQRIRSDTPHGLLWFPLTDAPSIQLGPSAGLFGSVEALCAVSAFSTECIGSGSIHVTCHFPSVTGVSLLGWSRTLPSAG
jgi:hypothetical protein